MRSLLATVTSLGLFFGWATPATPAFPVKPSPDNRHLLDQNGDPFPFRGRTAWFITSLSAPDWHTFVDDTVARGFTAIEFHVLNHDPRGNNPPFGGNGELPFLLRLDGGSWAGSLSYGTISDEAPDFTTPNTSYWAQVDDIVSYCESKGVLVLLFPAYVGYAGGEQGWMQEMVANGSTKIQTYGAWIADRYKNQKNLVWMLGGDMGTAPRTFSVSQSAVEAALIAGLQSVVGQQSTNCSAEWESESIATDQSPFGSSMTLNGVYSWTGDVNALGRRAYAQSPALPAFLLEAPFDQEGADGNGTNPSSTQPVRRFAWWGWLSTIGGYVAGNGYVWQFNTNSTAVDWRNHLDTQATRDLTRLNNFMTGLDWSKLVPSGLGGMRTLITSGGSTESQSDYVAAAATTNGTLLVAYIPPDHSGAILVDLGAMSGTTRARWFDPTSASYTDIAAGLTNSGAYKFTPPATNSAGDADWVLVLDAAASSPSPVIQLTAAPQSLTNIAQSGFKLLLSSDVPGTYTIEATTNFINWEPISTTVYSNGSMLVTDPGLPPPPVAFYRAVAVGGSPQISLAATTQPPELIAANGFHFLISSDRPGEFRVERSTNALQWEQIGSLSYTNGPVDFIDAPVRVLPFRFYRARLN
ncbi:MAG: hypothetical protein RLY20_792 [Verrucomicrobiota bacterium]|jgi:hypothetical protein